MLGELPFHTAPLNAGSILRAVGRGIKGYVSIYQAPGCGETGFGPGRIPYISLKICPHNIYLQVQPPNSGYFPSVQYLYIFRNLQEILF